MKNQGRSNMYGRRWRIARRRFLNANPLCVKCKERNRTTASRVVDHKTPHRGDQSLFWDESNWQALCFECHNRFKQSEEKGGQGFNRGCDTSGVPTDPQHAWHGERAGSADEDTPEGGPE
jgi:5-methylcytosine-specific restriction protein A